jgi:hypothetical protein
MLILAREWEETSARGWRETEEEREREVAVGTE